jgi:hypothetical protein
MDQTCPVDHKSRRQQARLKTVTLFYIHCGKARTPHLKCDLNKVMKLASKIEQKK